MNDALFMRRSERLCDLFSNGQSFVDRNRALRDLIRQCRAIYELQHERLDAIGLLKSMNRRDVRMVERCEDLRFPFEAGQPIGIEREMVGQDLEGDVPAQDCVAGLPDLAHPTGPDGRVDLIRAEANAGRDTVVGCAGATAGVRLVGSASRNCAVEMSPIRCLRSLARHRSTSVRIDGGASGGKAFQSGSRASTEASTSDTSSPSNARLPVSISNRTHPNAQMSLRLSAARPFACSGLMYAAVPRMIPTCVIAGLVIVGEAVASALIADVGSSAFANPKSSTFTVPSGRTLILAGLRSR